MSRIRTVDVEKQTYAPAVKVEGAKPGLQMKRIKGNYLKVDQLEWADAAWECANIEGLEQMKIQQKDDAATLRGANNYAAIAEGYINIPEDVDVLASEKPMTRAPRRLAAVWKLRKFH